MSTDSFPPVSPHKWLHSGIHTLFAVACVLGLYYSVRFARADYLARQNTPASLAEAVRLVPNSAYYLVHLASSQPDKEIALFQQSIALNPFAASVLIRLGLDAEIRERDTARAEALYLKAASVDNMYLPRLSLANFYFRQQRTDDCLRWARAALDITPSDSTVLLSQISMLLNDPERLDAFVPNRPGVLYDYLALLIANGETSRTASTVDRVLALDATQGLSPVKGEDAANAAHRELLYSAVDAALAKSQPDVALAIWSSLHHRGLVKGSLPATATPIGNPDFETPITNRGFDWAAPATPGVTIEQFPESHRLRLNLDGTQPESCRLLGQFAVLRPGQHYVLRWRAETDLTPPGQGLFWRLYTLQGQTATPMPTNLISQDITLPGQLEGKWEFTPPASARVFLLSFDYQRPAGKTRIDRPVSLLHVQAEPL